MLTLFTWYTIIVNMSRRKNQISSCVGSSGWLLRIVFHDNISLPCECIGFNHYDYSSIVMIMNQDDIQQSLFSTLNAWWEYSHDAGIQTLIANPEISLNTLPKFKLDDGMITMHSRKSCWEYCMTAWTQKMSRLNPSTIMESQSTHSDW